MERIQYGIPEIFEAEAKGHLKLVYEDIKQVLKVPIVNFIFRTLAQYEQFLTIGWDQVRANMLTINMEKAAEKLRYPQISFQAPKINWENYYQKYEVETIKRIIFTFNYVNPKLLLIATAWEEALGHRPVKGGNTVEGFIQPGIVHGLSNIKLINIPKAPPRVYHLLMDIINTHHAYDSASDYRALAYYPDFLEQAWDGTKKFVGTKEYILFGNQIKKTALDAVHQQMPYTVIMTPEYLTNFCSPRDVAGIMGLVSMYKEFIIGLIIDLECFRRYLD